MTTFPSAATAVQLAAARQSQGWQQSAPASAVAAPGFVRELVSTPAAAAARRATRGGAPAEFVAPTTAAAVAPAESQRLPGGRLPRGSFTWPKLAECAPARAEWSAPAAVAVAEQAKQAAPGCRCGARCRHWRRSRRRWRRARG